ncbi:hypothetical protein NQ314_008334 [Rhamnusium bicolor]|uniref:Uncharacterized protein n=1 Tax=Rhamnusium bicolor TaxID=1586634 RepID=A0AAV8YCG5_9CUCU|nr:hypothetical protein NQ314_008334 [Rhamnusium bicolor]
MVKVEKDDLSFVNLMQSLVATTALCSVIYTSLCFMIKKQEIKRLTENLKIFEEFLPRPIIEETEEKVKFYTIILILYGIFGNICYACLPLISFKDCMKNRTKHMIKYGIPCGTLARYVLPFKHDYFPLTPISIIEEAFVSTLGTYIILL